MYDVYIFFRGSNVIFRCVCNVTKITYERGFFRFHVYKTQYRDDLLFTLLLLPFNAFLLSMKTHNFSPAIPFDSPVSAGGQRWFLVDCFTADPFAERILGYFRRSSKYDLEGQIALWEHESKKTV